MKVPMLNPQFMQVDPISHFSRHFQPFIPADKSLSHRALLFSGIAQGKSKISNLLLSADTIATWKCLEQLGVKITSHSHHTEINGLSTLQSPTAPLDCKNSGTTMRLLMGLLAGQNFSSTLIGDDSLSKRPMKRVANPLIQMGANIRLLNDEFSPIHIQLPKTQRLKGIKYSLPIASAQVKSALILSGLHAEGTTILSGKIQSRDHTERLLPLFGCKISTQPHEIQIEGGQKLFASEYAVPSDFSSAAFWITAALIVPNASLKLTGISLNPTRIGYLNILKRMGAKIDIEVIEQSPEPIGNIYVFQSNLQATLIKDDEIPNAIDEIPLLAIIATHAEGETQVTGAQELRVKETDRLFAVIQGLKQLGVKCELYSDGFSIKGKQKIHAGQVDSFHDHRIAMAFSIAALQAKGPIQIKNAECVEVSYPNFYSVLKNIYSS